LDAFSKHTLGSRTYKSKLQKLKNELDMSSSNCKTFSWDHVQVYEAESPSSSYRRANGTTQRKFQLFRCTSELHFLVLSGVLE